jgi:DNA polymerase I-like protein with 3'-5' exonuclease and polymerase domains
MIRYTLESPAKRAGVRDGHCQSRSRPHMVPGRPTCDDTGLPAGVIGARWVNSRQLPDLWQAWARQRRGPVNVRLLQFALPDRIMVVDAGQVPVQRLTPVFAAPHLVAFHNAKFDLQFLRTAGLPWPEASIFDTMLVAQLLGAGTIDGQLKQCGLAAVVQRYLGLALDKALQMSDWTGTLTPAQLCYAARDAEVTLQLVSVLREALAAAALEQVAAIECRCVPALTWLERTGVPIDAQRWCDRAKQEAHQAQALEAQLQALLAQSHHGSGHLFPEALNWQSPQQVLDLLQHRGHAITTTDSETLSALVDADPLIAVLGNHSPDVVTVKEAAWQVMEATYLKARDQGRLPANARQMLR